MRVAIFAVSLLGIVGVHVSHAQSVPSVDGRPFTGATAATLTAVPANALQRPSFAAAELTMPTAGNTVLARGVNAHSPGFVRGAATPASHAALAIPDPRGPSTGGAAVPQRALAAHQPPVRSATDHLLAGVVAVMLIAYQLRRKHRVLRPHPFTT